MMERSSMSCTVIKQPVSGAIELPHSRRAPTEQPAVAAGIPTQALLDLIERQNSLLETSTAEEILYWAIEKYYPRFTMATAFGPEGCVIISMIAKIEPRVYVFNLDTGYQFQETLELRDRIAEKYGIVVDLQTPELSVDEYEAAHGGPVYRTDPDKCCFDRKVCVLRRVARNYAAWATGIRRDQSPTRTATPIVCWDKKFGLVKINPLATWTKNDVWRRILDERIPYNPLHARGHARRG
jgi:phosphoadenosine phosphosulfate reductase